MNFVHIGDVHFDVPFSTITERSDFGDERRLEQRKGFKQVIDFIKDKNVEYLFISGDLFENDYVRKSTIEYINNLFKMIPNTKIYITPGNHDPNIKNSYYQIINWSENVKIFESEVEKIENEDCDIYGFGFDNFEMRKYQLNDIFVSNKDKINILITHGDIYNDSKYNPMDKDVIEAKGFDYAAIGHIHKRDNYYPGSLISLGFDETGEHGFIYGEFDDKILTKRFIKVEQKEFCTMNLDISDLNSVEEIIDKINEIDTNNNFYEIYLVGTRDYEININIKLIQNNVIKIKDKTKIKIDIKENDNTTKGLFIKYLKEMKNNGEISDERYQNILLLGINNLEK